MNPVDQDPVLQDLLKNAPIKRTTAPHIYTISELHELLSILLHERVDLPILITSPDANGKTGNVLESFSFGYINTEESKDNDEAYDLAETPGFGLEREVLVLRTAGRLEW